MNFLPKTIYPVNPKVLYTTLKHGTFTEFNFFAKVVVDRINMIIFLHIAVAKQCYIGGKNFSDHSNVQYCSVTLLFHNYVHLFKKIPFFISQIELMKKTCYAYIEKERKNSIASETIKIIVYICP